MASAPITYSISNPLNQYISRASRDTITCPTWAALRKAEGAWVQDNQKALDAFLEGKEEPLKH